MSLAQFTYLYPLAVCGPIAAIVAAFVAVKTYSFLTVERKRSVMPAVVLIVIGLVLQQVLDIQFILVVLSALAGTMLGMFGGLLAARMFPHTKEAYLTVPTPPVFDPDKR